VRRLRGAYAQAGYFPHHVVAGVPEPLRIAYRYAFVDPDLAARSDWRQEHTVAVNWYMEGHDNKLTLELSRVSLEQPGQRPFSDLRLRLQWDVHF